MFKSSEEISRDFELRTLNDENGYNIVSIMNSNMRKTRLPANIENDQRYDRALMEQLAKAIEILPNLEKE